MEDVRRATSLYRLVLLLMFCGCEEPPIAEDAKAQPWLPEPKEGAALEIQPPKSSSLVFKEGRLPWAKSTHRVVVHRFPEAKQAKATTPCCADGWEWERPGLARHIAGSALYQLVFPTRLQPLSLSDEQDERTIKAATADETYFQGVYLPNVLTGDPQPTLHLFECPLGHLARYKIDQLYAVCSGRGLNHFYIEVARDSDAGTWLLCESRRILANQRINYLGDPDQRYILPPKCNVSVHLPVHHPWETVLVFHHDVESAPSYLVRTVALEASEYKRLSTSVGLRWPKNDSKPPFSILINRKARLLD